jgi:serine/threonine-protein kinase
MLTGHVPFAGDNTVSVALLHIQGQAEPIRDTAPDVPESLEKIVAKCMQKKQERRYQSASELIADLKMSISNPNGNFVSMNGSVPDSPTKQMTKEQLEEINAATTITSISDVLDDDEPEKRKKKKKKRDFDDDDDIDSMNSGLEKVLTVGSVFAVILVGVAVLYIIANYFDIFKTIINPGSIIGSTPTPPYVATNTPTPEATPTNAPDLVKMPSVVGLLDKDAVTSLKRISNTFSIRYEEEFSSEYEVGQVIAQYPPIDAQISANTEITLTICVGRETGTVPKVTNYSLAVARQALTDKGYTVEVDYEYDDLIEEGYVTRTDPEALTMVESGSKIVIWVSLGVNNTNVKAPALVGHTATEAQTLLEELELELGNVEQDWSDEYAVGVVISQSVDADEPVRVKSKIDIVVSKGPNPDPTPTPEPTPTEEPTPTPEGGGEPTPTAEGGEPAP